MYSLKILLSAGWLSLSKSLAEPVEALLYFCYGLFLLFLLFLVPVVLIS